MNRNLIFGLGMLCIFALSAVAVVAFGVDPLQPESLAMFTAEVGAASMADVEALAGKLKEVTGQFQAKSDELSKKAEDAMTEVKNKGALLTETKQQVDQLLVEQTTLTASKNKLETELAEAKGRLTGIEQELVRRPGGPATANQSIGQKLIAEESFKTFAAAGQSARGKFRWSVKQSITSVDIGPAAEPGGVIQPARVGGTLEPQKQRLFIRDLIPVGQTTAPLIWWVRLTGFTNAADVVSEGTLKPESDIAYDTVSSPVTTVAHTFKASKQVLDDFAQLKTDVDREMRYGLKYAEEREILFGDGSGIHLLGIVPQASAYSAAFAVPQETMIDKIRLAILQSQLARLPATGIVVHFIDWARIELTKDAEGRYIFSNPLRLATPSLWGLPLVATDVTEFQDKFLTGAFAGGAQIYDREEMNVEIATENEDDFVKNMITMRCEERIALATFRPEAFIYGDFGNVT